MAADPRFCTNKLRVANREVLDGLVQAVFAQLDGPAATARLEQAQTAYGAVNSVQDLIAHPQLRTKAMVVNGQTAQVPAAPYITEWDDDSFAPAPHLPQKPAKG
jgi:crotonobetainyl-CoA:carnitine CoA-transferase CaiB-like acyl-CoA transferase